MKLKLLAEYPTVIYLNDSGVEIDGLKFGVPVQPYFHNWAFNRIDVQALGTNTFRY
jgi:hypothetical protein